MPSSNGTASGIDRTPGTNTGSERSALESALRFSLRMTVSALATFCLVQVIAVPLHGLWAVLTAVIVTQASVGGSIRASMEYVLGTVIGAVYAILVSLLVPHGTPPTMGVALAVSIAPLAYAAARSQIFRVAPFTAIIVLLLAGQFGEGPISAAMTRLLEVALGGAVAVIVSLFVFPERAHSHGRRSAVVALERFAHALPVLLTGLSRRSDAADVQRIQDDLGAVVASFDTVIAEARHERALSLASRPGADALARTLLRLRHDLVIVGRAAVDPLPDTITQRLAPLTAIIGSGVRDYLVAGAHALNARRPAPPLAEAEAAMGAFAREVVALRNEGLTRPLSANEVEQLFALSFAFDQLRRDLTDLSRCIDDWTAM